MKRSTKLTSIWIVSIIIMALFAVYQRATGPTYPVSGKIAINSAEIKYKLLRTSDSQGDAEVKIKVPDQSITGKVTLKRYKSNDEWTTSDMKRSGDELIAYLPHQNPAGKIIYSINLVDKSGAQHPLSEKPVILRFKGEVPLWILIPHVLFIFLAYCFSTATAFGALTNTMNLNKMALFTSIFLFLAGIILGPMMQKYAFGAYWTGWPIADGQSLNFLKAGDLTDNKTLLALIMWIVAYFKTRNGKHGKAWVFVAAITLIAVFLIPHSVLGSEIDYTQMPK